MSEFHRGVGVSAVGYYEPHLASVFLPKCWQCGHKHPHAYMPPLPQDFCPSCGEPSVQPAAPQGSVAVLTGQGYLWSLARFFLKAGKTFAQLWRRCQ